MRVKRRFIIGPLLLLCKSFLLKSFIVRQDGSAHTGPPIFFPRKHAGSDAAIEAADVVLMDDKPSKVAEAVRIARRTLRIARENMGFAIGVKILVLALAALGLATLWMAVFADVGVTVLAVLNAMRALKV